ncbi:MAG TPA: hypothetical protein PLE35_06280, partial [Lentisphaeria bacterium]|nr:hypothetical protein [Lentisphaeria bacterium]
MTRHHLVFILVLALLAQCCVLPAYDRADLHVTGSLPASFTGSEQREHTLVFTGDIMPWERM